MAAAQVRSSVQLYQRQGLYPNQKDAGFFLQSVVFMGIGSTVVAWLCMYNGDTNKVSAYILV